MTKQQRRAWRKLRRMLKALLREVNGSNAYLRAEDYHLQGDLDRQVKSLLKQIGA